MLWRVLKAQLDREFETEIDTLVDAYYEKKDGPLPTE